MGISTMGIMMNWISQSEKSKQQKENGREVEKDIILKQVNGDKRKRRKVEKFLLQYKETPEQIRKRAAEACSK